MTYHATPDPSSAAPVCRSQDRHRSDKGQMCIPKVFERPRDFRAFFAHRWMNFLRANYSNPEAVSVAFGVRFQTACNWWNGENRPSGDVVALAFMRHGNDLAEHLGGTD